MEGRSYSQLGSQQGAIVRSTEQPDSRLAAAKRRLSDIASNVRGALATAENLHTALVGHASAQMINSAEKSPAAMPVTGHLDDIDAELGGLQKTVTDLNSALDSLRALVGR